jgi:hypothetical protein
MLIFKAFLFIYNIVEDEERSQRYPDGILMPRKCDF